jgi:hypothetical protein
MTQYQPYPGHYPQQQQQPPMRNGLGTAALTLGIVGAVVALIPIIGFIGFICGLVGVCLGVAGINRANKGGADNRTTAIIGTVLSVVAVIISIIVWSSFTRAVDDAFGPGTVTPAGQAPGVASEQPAVGSQAPAPSAAEPHTKFEAGQAADVDGLVVTGGPIKKVKQQFGDAVLCSDVTYVNNSGEQQSYNLFDWKLQNPNGVIATPTVYIGDGGLSSGELTAGGGKVAGKVCFDDPKLAGEYTVIYEPTFSGTHVEWKTGM